MLHLELIVLLGFIIVVVQLAGINRGFKELREDLRNGLNGTRSDLARVLKVMQREIRRNRNKEETNRMLENFEEEERKKIEWNDLTEEEREGRRIAAKNKGFCPKCDRHLSSKGSCPLCLEYPNNPNAPMHRVKRIVEWVSLTDEEKEAREAEFIALRARNLAEWATKGDDGIWRRKDNGAVVPDL
jgi:DNA repair exonuclease SbcCD ATPase subunit